MFVTIDYDGRALIKRGYVRCRGRGAGDSTTPIAARMRKPSRRRRAARSGTENRAPASVQRAVITIGGRGAEAEAGEDDVLRPLSDRLVTELTAHRSAALRDAVASEPTVAYLAVLHALCLNLFYHEAWNSCLELSVRSSSVSIQPPDLAASAYVKAIEARHKHWTEQLPKESGDLWDALIALHDARDRSAVRHCAALTINVSPRPRSAQGRIAHGDDTGARRPSRLGRRGLAADGENYLGRVPKARILEAVREAKGDSAAQLMEHLKKADMAREAERMLSETDWLPELLRLPGDGVDDAIGGEETMATEVADSDELPAFLADGAEASNEPGPDELDALEASDFAVAAE